MDLISRQSARDAVNDVIVDYIPTLYGRYEELPLAMAMAIMRLPTAEPESHWIPCSERLPRENGRYLVTRGLNACGSLWNRIYIANYSDLMGIKRESIWWQGNVGKSDFERLDDVLAWMPLPEPFRGQSDGA